MDSMGSEREEQDILVADIEGFRVCSSRGSHLDSASISPYFTLLINRSAQLEGEVEVVEEQIECIYLLVEGRIIVSALSSIRA